MSDSSLSDQYNRSVLFGWMDVSNEDVCFLVAVGLAILFATFALNSNISTNI